MSCQRMNGKKGENMMQEIKDNAIIMKINKVYGDLNESIEEHNKEYKEFLDELLTSDIKMMMQTIMDFNHDSKFTLYVNKHHFVLSGSCTVDNMFLYCTANPVLGYNQSGIESLQWSADQLQKNKNALRLLKENSEKIIECITQKYKDVVNNQMDSLDVILKMIGKDDHETRHIKVTVEWI